MKRLAYYTYAAWLLFAAALVLGCERRPIDDLYYNGLMVQVNIDWGTTSPKPEHLKMVWYPTSSAFPFTRSVSNAGEKIQLPYGHYRALLYSWRSNSDVQSVRFEAKETDTTFRAYTDFATVATFAEPALIQPDSLYAWSSGKALIYVTQGNKTAPSAVQYANELVVNTKPKSLVKQYSFFIPVKGLEYTTGARAMVAGMSQFVNVYNGSLSHVGCNMIVSVSQAEGGVKCRFSTFGYVANTPNIFTIKFRLLDGSVHKHVEDLSHEIHLGSVKDFTNPIIIPAVSGGGFQDPGIDGWNEIHQPIKF